MLAITKLKMWKDPGYTKGCLEVPPIGSRKLPSPDFDSYDEIRPRKESTLTSLELPLRYLEVFEMSYLFIEITNVGPAAPIELFGWIDSVEEVASSNSNVRINWTVDWWRSYSDSAVFKRGIITKTSDSTYKRPLRTQPRRWLLTSSNETQLSQRMTGGYIPKVFLFSYTVNDDIRFGLSTSLFKVRDSTSGHLGFNSGNIDSLAAKIGVNSSDIKGCWILSYLPYFEGSSAWYIDGAYLVITEATETDVETNNGVSWIDLSGLLTSSRFMTFTAKTTDDTHRTILTDSFGTPYLTIPYGFEIKSAIITLEYSATEAYHSVILSDLTSFNEPDYETERLKAIAEGRFVQIPLVSIATASSALSDYYVSGQREFDITTRRMDQERAAWQGALGIGGSVAGGGVAGAMAGAPVVGMAAGLISGAVSTIGNYWITEQYNDKLTAATDKLYANQASTLITSGSTNDKIQAADRGFWLITLTADSVSEQEMNDQIATQGYDVEIPTTNVSSFLTTGPVQINNLTVTGEIPPMAKAAIKMKLENGVYIVENNPGGIVP